MAVKKKAGTTSTTVAPVQGMDITTLAKHTEHPVFGRHRQTMRFITVNEHEQDHRINAALLDHVHSNQVEESTEEETE